MSRWRKRLLTIAAGLIAGFAAIVGLQRIMQPPFEGQLTLFVSSSCPHSVDLLRQLEGRSELAERIVVFPSDEGDIAWNDLWCQHAVSRTTGLTSVASKALPRSLVCSWLGRGGSAFHSATYTYTPAWSLGQDPVQPADRAGTLLKLGLVLEPTNELHLVDEQPRRTGPPPRVEDDEAGEDPMRWATGHTVGF